MVTFIIGIDNVRIHEVKSIVKLEARLKTAYFNSFDGLIDAIENPHGQFLAYKLHSIFKGFVIFRPHKYIAPELNRMLHIQKFLPDLDISYGITYAAHLINHVMDEIVIRRRYKGIFVTFSKGFQRKLESILIKKLSFKKLKLERWEPAISVEHGILALTIEQWENCRFYEIDYSKPQFAPVNMRTLIAFSDKFIININAKLKIDFGADLVEKCMCHATDNWGLNGIFTILHRIHQDHLVRIFVNHYYFKEVSNDEMLVEPAYVLLICDKHLYSKRLLRS
uniref:DUF1835 domain-containing protein n=1 Tax=Rhabditophanes sp. KR3021 TaxID=114890 RepID=A0AC35U8U9_9BILA